MSEIKVNSIKGVGASTAAITVNNTDGTCTANITNNLSNRNLIINGAMQVAQRGTSSTTSGYGSVDRFRVFVTGVDENPTQAQADVVAGTTPYTSGFRKCLKVTNGNQTSGAGASDYLIIRQIIEAQDIANSGWNYTDSNSKITLQFWVKSSVAQNFYGRLQTRDGTTYSYPFETGSLSADTWTKITKTIVGNSNLTFNNDNGAGLNVEVVPFYGTDFTASPSLNTWAAHSSSSRTPDYTSTWYTTNDATFEITGVQLEVGSVATDFEHRSITDEIIRCERYYRRDDADGQVYYRFAQGQCTSSTGSQYVVKFPVRMRAAPTLATSGTITAYTVNSQKTTGTISIGDATTQGCIISANASGFSAGNCVDLIASGDGNAYVEFIAEL